MSKMLITGRRRLCGDVTVQGAKNSALPILAATVLTKGESVLYNCPDLSDVEASLQILRYLGLKAQRSGGTVLVQSDGLSRHDIPDDRSALGCSGICTAAPGKG